MTVTGLLDPEDEPRDNSGKAPVVFHVQVPSQITTTQVSWAGTPVSSNGNGSAGAFRVGTSTGNPEAVYQCSVSGHLILDHSVETINGTVVGYCEHCGEKFTMYRFPGGVNSARVKSLIDAATDEEWLNPEAILLEYNYLTEALEADVSAVVNSVSLMDVARAIISARLGGDDSNA